MLRDSWGREEGWVIAVLSVKLTNSEVRVIYQEENGCTEQAKMDEKLRPDADRLNFYQY